MEGERWYRSYIAHQTIQKTRFDMKKTFYTFFLLFFLGKISAQVNLVPNPSFEDTIKCPHTINTSTIGAKDWTSYGGTVDYFNACAPNNACGVSVPANYAGYQPAATGNAYAGFVAVQSPQAGANIREYIGAKLISPLVKNKKYNVSFKVCLAEGDCMNFNMACNKLGVKFTMNPLPYLSAPPVYNSAHVYTNTIISDSTNWTKISGTYVADTTYKYIVVGNFFNDANTSTLSVGAPNIEAYYYLDDINVSADTVIINTTGINEVQFTEKLNIFPNPASDHISIQFPFEINKAELNILNAQDQSQIKKTVFNQERIDVSMLSDGFYIVKITGNGKTFQERIIVRH
jgi:hypothetical protein